MKFYCITKQTFDDFGWSTPKIIDKQFYKNIDDAYHAIRTMLTELTDESNVNFKVVERCLIL